jgi:transposase
MLTREEDIDAHALRKRGWTISAIARHLDRDRKTVRAYLSGDRTPGVRTSTAPDWFAPFAVYLAARCFAPGLMETSKPGRTWSNARTEEVPRRTA